MSEAVKLRTDVSKNPCTSFAKIDELGRSVLSFIFVIESLLEKVVFHKGYEAITRQPLLASLLRIKPQR